MAYFNWEYEDNIPYPFYGGAAVIYHNVIHILGTIYSGSSINEGLNHYTWNSLTHQWENAGALPYAMAQGCAVVYNDKIHVLGFKDFTDRHYSWNGVQWVEESEIPFSFLSGQAVVYNNKIHILGSDVYGHYKEHYSWDGTQWVEESTLPYSFSYGSAVVYDNKIHILGGSDTDSHYSWNGSQWTEESTLPYELDWGSAVVYDGKIHILGGSSYWTNHYSWNGTQWIKETDLPYQFYWGSAVVYDNKIHLLGGQRSTPLDTRMIHFSGLKIKSRNKIIYGNETLMDLTADTVTESDVLSGVTFHDASGDPKTGTCTYDADTSDATAAAADILSGKTAYVNGTKITGTGTAGEHVVMGTFNYSGTSGITVNVGFKPRFLAIQRSDASNNVVILYNEDASNTKYFRCISGTSAGYVTFSSSLAAYGLALTDTGFITKGYNAASTFTMRYLAIE